MVAKKARPEAEDSEVIPPRSPSKRMIAVTSDKGGNGKSTLARLLAEIFIQRNIPTLAFDCDKRNAQLYRYYNQAFSSAFNSGAGVIRIDLTTQGGADKLINSFDSEATQVILIDFPAGGGELFEKFEKEIQLFDLLDEVGYQLTMVSVLSRIKDSIMSLRTLADYCGDRATHVVVRNNFFGTPDKFRRFNNSKTSELVLQKGGIVIDMPDLFDDTYDLLDDKDLSFAAAIEAEGELPMADRRRVRLFREEAEAELMKAAAHLGLA